MREIELSTYGLASTAPSPVNRMMAAFAADFRNGVDVNLGVGYVNERTIPRDLIAHALCEVARRPDRYRAAYNYGGPSGSPNLVASIRNLYSEHGIDRLPADVLDRLEIVVGASGATSLLEAIAAVLPPGIVVTADPIYYIFCDLLQRQGFELLTVPEDADGLRTNLLRQKLEQLGKRRSEIRFFYVVSVNNPTSTVLSNPRRRELVEIVNRLSQEFDRKVPLIFDTAYEMLVHGPNLPTPQSPLLQDELRVVYEISTLSKILAPGLRIGYMLGPPCDFTRAVVQKVSDVGFSAPLLTQEMSSWLLDHHIKTQIASVKTGYATKSRALRQWIQEHLGRHLERCDGGEAGFYYYLTFKDIETHDRSAFFRFLARRSGDPLVDGPIECRHPRVMYVPGEFCVSPTADLAAIGQRQLRIAYGFEELDMIEKGMRWMGDAAEYARRPQPS